MDVRLHIYDVTNTPSERANSVIMTVNNLTRDIGGVFHGAVEICGKEWSFGYCEAGSGVYACLPKMNPAYTYRETIEMGKTDVDIKQLNVILRKLREEWPGRSYDLLGRNCCHFSEEFCEELGVGPVPGWINRFAYGAESAVSAVQTTYESFMWLGSTLSKGWNATVTCMLPGGDEEDLMIDGQQVLLDGDEKEKKAGERATAMEPGARAVKSFEAEKMHSYSP